jgi:PAS domain S-box-containing protein
MQQAHSRLIAARGPVRVGSVALGASDSGQAVREKLARIVLDGMYQFVGLLDAEGGTLEINRAALQGAGLRLEDIVGRPFWEARWFQVSLETIETQRDYVRRAAQGEFIRCDMEVLGEAAGDRTIIVDFSLSPIRDDEGHVVFLLAEGRNISEKKRIEAELARRNTELQALVEQVRQLDRLKSDMFANVSHELRTPLALILGPAEEMLATGTNLDASQRQQLGVIHRNAAALLRHVNDLLDLAKLDARKMEPRFVQLDLVDLVRNVAGQFEAIAPQRSLSYVVHTPDSLPGQVDPDKIERVLLNLLSNAFKFTPAGGHIRCALERARPGRALLTVLDSGPGIEPGMRDAVFERFRQVQHGTTRDAGGTGLGLAIAREFVELHRGTIVVTQAPGGGALFQVEFPLQAPPGAFVAERADADRPPAVPEGLLAEVRTEEAMPPDPVAAGGRASVLVVEDNPDMRHFVRNALASRCHVVAVADGPSALEHAIASPPDLIVTDLMLPGFGGDVLVQKLRAVPALADVPVLVLSARGEDALRARLLAESVQDYVTKPFSAHELRARVHNLATMKLARDALRQELASQGDDLADLTRELIANRRELQQSEHRWWTIYEHSPVGIALTEPSGQVRAANPAFHAMLGYGDSELRGSSLQDITPAEDRAAMQARIASLLEGQVREYHVERRFQRKGGAIVWSHTSVAIVPAGASGTPLLVVVAEDVTEQRRAEQALARTQHELAVVARATTLGEMAASIAHEVNQPLAAIAANGQAVQRWLDAVPPNEGEARSAVKRIVRDANRASDVIARIRRFVRRGELAQEAVSLPELVDEVFALVRHESARLRVTLSRTVSGDVSAVAADRVQIQQVLLNLVMNAMEAMARADLQPRSVDITVRRHDPDTMRVDVRDRGPGIAPAIHDQVFEAFQTTKPNGMGMGLAISRSIIEAHGGRLWFTPNPGRGVTFSFTLPCTTS